jgi:broad specificity phosphatase PhoE
LNRVFKRLSYNFTRIYSSDLQRAAHTAKIYTQDLKSPGIIFSPLLRELDLGILAKRYDHSLSEQEKARLATLWVDYSSKIEGGESINQLINRNRLILKRILSGEGIGEKILIISHGGVIYTILCRILMFKIDVDEWLKNCQINELMYDHLTHRMKLIKLNGDQLRVPQDTENRI